jgi:hypothetical protein
MIHGTLLGAFQALPHKMIGEADAKTLGEIYEILRSIEGDNLSKAGWSWGCVSAIDSNELTRSGLQTRIAAVSRRIGLTSHIRLSGVLVKSSSITSSDVSTYVPHG